jgi:hypothetical protein
MFVIDFSLYKLFSAPLRDSGERPQLGEYIGAGPGGTPPGGAPGAKSGPLYSEKPLKLDNKALGGSWGGPGGAPGGAL